MPVRPMTALPGGEPTLRVKTVSATTTIKPCGLSNDRTTLYASDNGVLKQSTDEGVTWSTVYSGWTAGWEVTGLVETDDGEAIAFINAFATGRIYKSTGWSTSHTTATWALVLSSTGGYPAGYGVNCANFGDDTITEGTSKYGVSGMYGTQTSASGGQTTKGRYVYWTEDYGTTWTEVFDIHTWAAGVVGLHIHAAAYDPWWDRIWVAWGDSRVNAALSVVYSDDHGATWEQVPASDVWGPSGTGSTSMLQSTTVLPREKVIVFGSDPAQGLWVLPRKRYRVIGQPEMLMMHATGTTSSTISTQVNSLRRTAGAPITACWTSQGGLMRSGIAVSWDGGRSFRRVFDLPYAVSTGITTVYGPTINGTYLFLSSLSGVYTRYTAELVKAREGVMNRTLRATGDGTTTAFTLPHYLGKVPDSVLAYAQSAAALSAYTVTADTTNVTVTFTAAPANSAHIQVSLLLSA